MRIFRFDEGAGRKMDMFGSINCVWSKIGRLDSGAQLSCFHLGPEGKVGYHQAATRQLMLVVQGQGWVRGEAKDSIAVAPGCAAFWEKDEWHESGTPTGMMAIVIEADSLNPAEFMPAAHI